MQRMFYSNSNSTNTSQASVHEREKSVAEIAGPRFNLVLNAVNNLYRFSPSEESNSTTDNYFEVVPTKASVNATIAGEVVVSSEVNSQVHNDPVASNSTADQTLTYTATNPDKDTESVRSDVATHALSSAEMNGMFEDPALKEMI